MLKLIEPHEEVKDFVDTYYYSSDENFPSSQWFPVPTLIRSWLVFRIKGKVTILRDNKEYIPPKICIKGPFDQHYLIGYPETDLRIILAQFSITGFYELTGIDVTTIKNSHPDAYNFWDEKLLNQLDQELADSSNIEHQKGLIDQFFLQQKEQKETYEISDKSTLVKEAIKYARQENFALNLPGISEHIAVSSKTMERAFKTVTGITPKRFLSGCLFEELIRELVTKKDTRISEIMSSPFYDFSHINKWFSKYANLPPSAFNQQNYHLLEEVMKHQNQF